MGEMGIKPWDFRRMGLDDYHQTCQGYLTARQKDQVPFRKLYQLIHDCNSKHPIQAGKLEKIWPLHMLDGSPDADEDYMKDRWERSRAANAARKKITHG